MKKKLFLKFFVLAVIGAFVTFTSCKDYDDDISRLDGDLTALKAEVASKAELSTLKEALETKIGDLESEIANLKADLAKAATKEELEAAKAEIISKTVSLETYNNFKEWVEDEIADLKADLAKAATKAEVNAIKEALESEIADLKTDLAGHIANYEALLEVVKGNSDAIADIFDQLDDQLALINENKQDIEDLLEDLKDLQDKVDANYTELNGKISALDSKLEGFIVDIRKELKAVQNLLRSLVLVPHQDVNGVKSVNYLPLQYLCGDDEVSINPVIRVHYILNPSTVTEEGIDTDNLTYRYLYQENELRSAQIDAKATFVEIKDGEIIVDLELNSEHAEKGGWFKDDGTGNIIATPGAIDKMDKIALQVPLKGVGEGETITSDWARVNVKPIDGAVIDNKDLLGDDLSYSSFADECATNDELAAPYLFEIPWEETVKLSESLVVMGGGKELDLEAYGMNYKFSVATEGCEEEGYANFIEIVDATTGEIKATGQAAVGRDQYLKVELIDSQNDCDNPVTFGYIKIKFTNDPITKEVDLDAFLDCDVVIFSSTEEWMKEVVYPAFGLTSQEFNQLYVLDDTSGIFKDAEGEDAGLGKLTAQGNLFNWSIDICDVLSSADKKFTGYLFYNYRNGGYENPALIIKVNGTVKMPNFGVYGHNETYWLDNFKTFRLNPVVSSNPGANPTVNYNADMLLAFNTKTPGVYASAASEIVKTTNASDDYEPCNARFEFDPTKLDQLEYKYDGVTYSVAEGNLELSNNNTILKLGSQNAARIDKVGNSYTIKLTEGGNLNESATVADWRGGLINNFPRNGAKALIGNKVPVRLVADYCCEITCEDLELDPVVVKSFDVLFMVPLTIDAELDGKFYDAIEGGSIINGAAALTYTDWRGYNLAKSGTTQEVALYNYYVLLDPEWKLNDIKTNLSLNTKGDLVPTTGVTDGPLPTKTDGTKAYTVTLDGDNLVFDNIGATLNPTNPPLKLFIPVSVKHKWGETTNIVSIEVYPNPVNQ